MCAVALKSAIAAKKSVPARKAAKKPHVTVEAPSKRQLDAVLGEAAPVWPQMMAAMKEHCSPFEVEWRPHNKAEFGRYCLLRRKDRTLLYLLPKPGMVEVTVVLGERAYELAMNSSLPARIKKFASEARDYAEGRFIRFPAAPADVPHIVRMVEFKLTPK